MLSSLLINFVSVILDISELMDYRPENVSLFFFRAEDEISILKVLHKELVRFGRSVLVNNPFTIQGVIWIV